MKALRPTILLTLLFALLGSQARAQSIPDFLTARGIAVGGTRAFASGADAIFLNPAGLALTPAYILELDYGHDMAPSSTLTSGDGLVASIADGVSNPHLATGVAYRYASLHVNGVLTRGSIADLAFATTLTEHLLLGIRASYLTYSSEAADVKHFTGDVGMMLLLGPVVISGVGFNLISVDSPDAPRGFSVGAAYTNRSTFNLGGDVRWQYFGGTHYEIYSAGGEYLVAQHVPIRLGFLADTSTNARYVTGGTGFYLSSFGFDATYRRDLHSGQGAFIFAAKVFVGAGG